MAEEGLTAEEQGGFRKMRGCRDHTGIIISAIGSDGDVEEVKWIDR